MKNLSFIAASVAALMLSVPASAAPVELNFSFDGVSGTFFGLDDVDGTSSATSVFIDGKLDDYSFSIGPATPDVNTFTFSGGLLTAANFQTTENTFGDTNSALFDDFDFIYNDAGLITPEERAGFLFEIEIDTVNPDFAVSTGIGSSVFFEVVSGETGPSPDPDPDPNPVPLPAGAILLISGIAGFAALRRRRKPDA